MLLLIDNYDSFTWNLVQRIGELDQTLDVRVVRNDQMTLDEAEAMKPTHLVISPGPCTPRETGICPQLIAKFRGRIPILGVCLGHQTIADVHGMTVRRHNVLMHGKTSPIHHDGRGIYKGLPNPFIATRYHSLIVDRQTVGGDFEISAWTTDGGERTEIRGQRSDTQQDSALGARHPAHSFPPGMEVMGLRWVGTPGAAPMDGVQFHPESFLTLNGPLLLANFLGLARPEIVHV